MLEKKLKRYVRELIILLKRIDLQKGLSADEIELARQGDMGSFVECDKRGFAKCVNPEHEDRNPSMYIKNGFAYCFSCGWSGDVIDVVMSKHKVNFVEAVKIIVREE